MPLAEAVALVRTGEIRDGKTVCGLLLAKDLLEARRKKEEEEAGGRANGR